MGILKRIHRMMLKRIKPLEYARLVGVNMAGGVHLYGHVEWSSEPWIITLGKNVHITDCK